MPSFAVRWNSGTSVPRRRWYAETASMTAPAYSRAATMTCRYAGRNTGLANTSEIELSWAAPVVGLIV